jgi:hypothetical protein
MNRQQKRAMSSKLRKPFNFIQVDEFLKEKGFSIGTKFTIDGHKDRSGALVTFVVSGYIIESDGNKTLTQGICTAP